MLVLLLTPIFAASFSTASAGAELGWGDSNWSLPPEASRTPLLIQLCYQIFSRVQTLLPRLNATDHNALAVLLQDRSVSQPIFAPVQVFCCSISWDCVTCEPKLLPKVQLRKSSRQDVGYMVGVRSRVSFSCAFHLVRVLSSWGTYVKLLRVVP